jgi:hypothetical protein
MMTIPLPPMFQRSCCACFRTGLRQDGRTGAEVVDAVRHDQPLPSIAVELTLMTCSLPFLIASSAATSGLPSRWMRAERRVRAVVDDVLDLFHVDRAVGEHAEHVSPHAGPVSGGAPREYDSPSCAPTVDTVGDDPANAGTPELCGITSCAIAT